MRCLGRRPDTGGSWDLYRHISCSRTLSYLHSTLRRPASGRSACPRRRSAHTAGAPPARPTARSSRAVPGTDFGGDALISNELLAWMPQAREHFLGTGEVLPEGVRDVIARSWERSLRAQVDPETPNLPFVPDIDGHSVLAEAATPVARSLLEEIADPSAAIVLSNQDGCVIEPLARQRGARLAFRQLERRGPHVRRVDGGASAMGPRSRTLTRSSSAVTSSSPACSTRWPRWGRRSCTRPPAGSRACSTWSAGSSGARR